jgi:hypothetical protein
MNDLFKGMLDIFYLLLSILSPLILELYHFLGFNFINSIVATTTIITRDDAIRNSIHDSLGDATIS